VVKFKATPEGLYQFKVPESYKNQLKKPKSEAIMIQTVEENKIWYTP